MYFFQDEDDDDNPSTEDKGTNTVDVMNGSFETVELTEGGDLLEIGEPGEHEEHVLTRWHLTTKSLIK